jgi:hypothetical protein
MGNSSRFKRTIWWTWVIAIGALLDTSALAFTWSFLSAPDLEDTHQFILACASLSMGVMLFLVGRATRTLTGF